MLTLATVERILGRELPVPGIVPKAWGGVRSVDWQVDPASLAARLQISLGGNTPDRPGLITVDYQRVGAPPLGPDQLDPWHLVFEGSLEDVAIVLTLNVRCPRPEAIQFADSFSADEFRLVSYETLEEARRRGIRSEGRDAPSGGSWNADSAVWFDRHGQLVSQVTIDAEIAQESWLNPLTIQHEVGVVVPSLSSWPRSLGLLSASQYQQLTRPIASGLAVRAVSALWWFQRHFRDEYHDARVSIRFRLDDQGAGDPSIGGLGPWRIDAVRSQPRFEPQLWNEIEEALRVSLQ